MVCPSGPGSCSDGRIEFFSHRCAEPDDSRGREKNEPQKEDAKRKCEPGVSEYAEHGVMNHICEYGRIRGGFENGGSERTCDHKPAQPAQADSRVPRVGRSGR